MEKKYAIGADIGGSHISTVLVEIETGTVFAESFAEIKVDNQASATAIFENWAKAIRTTLQYANNKPLTGIGFAMPGPFDYKNGVALLKNVAKYESLYGLNVGDELRKILGLSDSITFRYINDALGFAIGECWIGSAAKYKNVVSITLGTGFGSAFLRNGVPVLEGDHVPASGYLYNIPYKSGIADEYFSTRWFLNEYKARTGLVCKGVKDLVDIAATEKLALELFEEFGAELAGFMVPILAKFDAECLVIGGNISGAYHLFGLTFQNVLNSNELKLDVTISGLKESAAMVGSARLLDEIFWNNIEPLVAKI
ncbi:MAG: ROK family protein [Niabella sp.]